MTKAELLEEREQVASQVSGTIRAMIGLLVETGQLDERGLRKIVQQVSEHADKLAKLSYVLPIED